MYIIKVAHELYGGAMSQPQGRKMKGLEPQLVYLLRKVSLVLRRRIHICPSSEIWT